MIIHGDCLLELKKLEDASIDSLVTDPPAGISFMSKKFDTFDGREHFISEMQAIFEECLRVMKPGAHGLVWALPRTSHWTATALENAGFEIRDKIFHLQGQGFPKSLDISKAIDKAAGAQRVAKPITGPDGRIYHTREGATNGWKNTSEAVQCFPDAITDEAKQWQGWGTNLKPSVEEWVLIRKPISEKAIAENVLKWGCGALNIDKSRIGFKSEDDRKSAIPFGDMTKTNVYGGNSLFESKTINDKTDRTHNQGRFPSHLLLSHNEDCEEVCTPECSIFLLDEQSGEIKTKLPFKRVVSNASRFFYCAKASKRERNEGCDGLPEKLNDFQRESSGLSTTTIDGVRQKGNCGQPNSNHHPTVKPIKLMSYLITLVTPPNGIVLDCFAGSGSTGVAAIRSGFNFIGIEKELEYFEIAKKRLEAEKNDKT